MCPFAKRAKGLLRELGADFKAVEMDQMTDGKAIKAELGLVSGAILDWTCMLAEQQLLAVIPCTFPMRLLIIKKGSASTRSTTGGVLYQGENLLQSIETS